MALPSAAVDREYKKFVEDADGNVCIRVYLGSDIEIGAVEIKDHDGTDRVAVTASNELSVLDSNSADIKSNTDNIPSDPSTESKQDDVIGLLTTPTGINGGPVTVGTSAVEMTFTGTTRIISLKADSTNSGIIWFGPATVDSAGANAYGELTADSAVEIELNDAGAALYCCSDTAAQKVYKAALT